MFGKNKYYNVIIGGDRYRAKYDAIIYIEDLKK